MRKIYQAVVVPQLLYGLSAWFCPATGSLPARERNRAIAAFARIQKRAAIIISGAFKGTSGEALDVELFLRPIALQMQQIIEEAAIRIQTGPVWAQPATLRVQRRPEERRIGGWCPLEAMKWKKREVLHTLSAPGMPWETRQAFVLAPWEPRIQCHTAESTEAAIDAHDQVAREALDSEIYQLFEPFIGPESGESAPIQPTVIFFTDGSGKDGHVGASVVAPGQNIKILRYLGTTEDSTVYLAELHGVEMALGALRGLEGRIEARKVVIFTDSQAAIQAIASPKASSGQYVIRAIYQHLQAANWRVPIEIRWIPAHLGVAGNETADVEAKLAAQSGASGEVGPRSHVGEPEAVQCGESFRLASSARRWVRQRMKARWAAQWAKSKVAVRYRQQLAPGEPSKKVLRLYNRLPKPYTSILVQMRTKRIALRHFLYKYTNQRQKDPDLTDQCQCEEGSQTPAHVLLHCPLYTDLRTTMFNKIWYKTDLGRTTNYNEILSHSQAIRYVAEFIHRTDLLGQFRCVDYEDVEATMELQQQPEEDDT